MSAVAFEGEEIHREAAFWENYLSSEQLSSAMSLVGAAGASAQMKSQQLSRFHQALVRYENALLAIQSPAAPGMPGAGARTAEAIRHAYQAYDALVTEHRAAMASLAPAVMRAKTVVALSTMHCGGSHLHSEVGEEKLIHVFWLLIYFKPRRLKNSQAI